MQTSSFVERLCGSARHISKHHMWECIPAVLAITWFNFVQFHIFFYSFAASSLSRCDSPSLKPALSSPVSSVIMKAYDNDEHTEPLRRILLQSWSSEYTTCNSKSSCLARWAEWMQYHLIWCMGKLKRGKMMRNLIHYVFISSNFVPKTLTTSHKLLYFHHLSSHAEAPTKAFLQVRYRCEIFNNVQGLPHDPIRRYTVGFTVHWCHRYIFKSVYPSKPDSYTGYTRNGEHRNQWSELWLYIASNKSAGFWMKHQLAGWECPPIHTLYSFFAKLGGIKCCSPVFAWYCSSVSLCPGFICTFYWPLVMQWHTTCKTLSLPSHA